MSAKRTAIIASLLVALSACGAGATGTPTGSTGPTADGGTGTALLASSTTGDEPIVDVVAAALPSVVTVRSQVRTLSPFGASDGEAVGTGFVVRDDGFILTNQHVVDGASSVAVTTASGDEHRAAVVAEDAEHDLAVLKIDADGLTALTLGASETLAMGETVVAIGFALGLSGGPTVTSGIISSLDRTIDVQDPSGGAPAVRTYRGLLQTDAALNHGNSGGPLLTLDGRVVGVNVAGGDAVENIGFAIPIDTARPLMDDAFGQTT
jgi:serine protease Do